MHIIKKITYDNIESFIKNKDFFNAISLNYPEFETWLSTKVFPGLEDETRSIYVAYKWFKPVGMMILKDTAKEKKISTLYISPEYKKTGIGSEFINIAVRLLKNNIIIHMPESVYNQNCSFFNKHKFRFDYKTYKNNRSEFYLKRTCKEAL